MERDPYADAKRLGVDQLLFGPDGQRVTFGALTLGGIGAYSYGAACVVLSNDESVTDSASVLEDNSYNYFETHGPKVKAAVPEGARALWEDAADLAISKHEHALLLQRRWRAAALRSLLLFSEGNKRTDKYLEVQLAAPITRGKIDRIVYDASKYQRAGSSEAADELALVAEHSRNLAATLLTSGRLAGIEVEILDWPPPKDQS